MEEAIAQAIITSQIGYRKYDPKSAFIRSDSLIDFSQAVSEIISSESGKVIFVTDKISYYGRKWGIYFWRIDFGSMIEEGDFKLRVNKFGLESTSFRICDYIFFNETFFETSVYQLEKRVKGKFGWQDCGSDMRGLEPNAVQVIGLVDGLEAFKGLLSDEKKRALVEQIKHGGEYLLKCQRENGSFVNEYYIMHEKASLTLALLAIIALARAGETTNSVEYLDGAKSGWTWCLEKKEYSEEEVLDEIEETRKIFGKYKPWIPPRSLRARDKLLLIWAGIELYNNTNDLRYKRTAMEFAEEICSKMQNLDQKSSPTGVFGNFLAWEGNADHQKAWEHLGWGYNCGSVMPDEIAGLFKLLNQFENDKRSVSWRYALRQFAYGYVKPTATLSPMGIYPLGMFNEEIRFFGPSWHGFSGMYARIARSIMLLARLFEDQDLESIALNNIQWIAGLNVGSISEKGQISGLCMINGIGTHFAKPWSDIRGSIVSGFCANPQFKLVHLHESEDAPTYLSLEDWILYNGQWLSGISEIEMAYVLTVRTQFKGESILAQINIEALSLYFQTNSNGICKIESIPRFFKGNIQITWNGMQIEKSIISISGLRKELIIDFYDHFIVTILVVKESCYVDLKIENRGKYESKLVIYLRSVGIELKKEKIYLNVQAGKATRLKVQYDVKNKDIPRYIHVFGRSKYSFSEGEATWAQEGR